MEGSRKVLVGLVQQSWYSDPQAHKEALTKGVAEAKQHGAQLVCLQELTMHRYFADTKDAKHFALAEPVDDNASGPDASFFSSLAKQFEVHLVGSLFEKEGEGESAKYRNTAVVFGPSGELIGKTRKIHIPRGTGYNEDYYFQSDNSNFPIYDLGFIKLGVPTCYDQWFPELSRIYALKGVELLVYPTAIGSEPDFPGFNTQPMWQQVISTQGIVNGIFVAAVNRIGNEGMVTFYGSSFVSDPTGKVVAQGPRDSAQVVMATLDFSVFSFWRKLFPLCEQRQPYAYGPLL